MIEIKMKHYPKAHEDISSRWDSYNKFVGSAMGSVDDLILRFRSFYKKAHESIFDIIVREIWLEQQITVNGNRRIKRRANGLFEDISFANFTKCGVGISHKVITASMIFHPISTYLIDIFPDFLNNNPFESPDKFRYPYKNINLDFLFFVHQMDERLELLAEADKRNMLFSEFVNWATNWALCYNSDHGVEKYELSAGNRWEWLMIKNIKHKRGWENKKFLFNVK